MTKVIVRKSPDPEEEGLPWEYSEDAFIDWVDEVFREGYKKENPPMHLDKAVQVITGFGYEVELCEGL